MARKSRKHIEAENTLLTTVCCNHMMSRRKKKHIYICNSTRYQDKPNPCYETEIFEEDLENALFQIISKQAEIIANIDSVADLDELQLQTERTIELEHQINMLKSEKQRLYEQLLMREIELTEYQAARQECNQKLQSIQQLYDKSVDETEQMKFAAKTKAETIKLAKDISKENGFTQTLSDMLIDKVVVFPDKHLEISWKVQDFCQNVQE